MTTDTRDARNSTDSKSGEYLRELMDEKHKLDSSQWPNAARLLDQGKAHTQHTCGAIRSATEAVTGDCCTRVVILDMSWDLATPAAAGAAVAAS